MNDIITITGDNRLGLAGVTVSAVNEIGVTPEVFVLGVKAVLVVTVQILIACLFMRIAFEIVKVGGVSPPVGADGVTA